MNGRLRPLPTRQLAALLLVTAVLLIVVGMATHANVQAGSSSLSKGRAGLVLDVLVAAIVLVSVIVCFIAVWLELGRFQSQFSVPGGPPTLTWKQRIVAVLILAVLTGGGIVAYVVTHQLRLTRHALPALTNLAKQAATASQQVNWGLVGGAGGGAIALTLVGGGVFLLLWRSRELSELAVSLEALAVGIKELEAELDPRRAVIRAYAAMEGVLSELGLRRHLSEAPFEYLGRILIDGGAPRPATTRLTELFEHARFSQHEIESGLKTEALKALLDVREGVRAVVTARRTEPIHRSPEA